MVFSIPVRVSFYCDSVFWCDCGWNCIIFAIPLIKRDLTRYLRIVAKGDVFRV